VRAEGGRRRVRAGRRDRRPPGLADVLVGEDPGSAIYVANKQKASAESGSEGRDHRLAADSEPDEVAELLAC